MPRVRSTLLALAVLAASSADPAGAEPWRSSNECRLCHRGIHAEWALSRHATSFSNPAFQERWQDRDRPSGCLSCHAPKPVLETGLDRPPAPRDRNLADGVSCITCHSAGPIVAGPRGIRRTGLSCGLKAYGTPSLCAPCHGQPCSCYGVCGPAHGRQVGQWAHGPFRFSVSCQGCHMPERTGRVAELRSPEMPARTIHSHAFPGSGNADFVRSAIEFQVDRQGDELLLTLVNGGAGHDLPATDFQSLVVRCVFLDDAGLELDHRISYLDAANGNRLAAGGSRVISWLLHEGWRRVRLTILLRRAPTEPERHWLLLHHRVYDLLRPFDPPPTHSIADRLRQTHTERRKLQELLDTPTTVDEWGRKGGPR